MNHFGRTGFSYNIIQERLSRVNDILKKHKQFIDMERREYASDKPDAEPRRSSKKPGEQKRKRNKKRMRPGSLYFRRSIISITIADETLTDAANRIKNMMKSSRFLEVWNE